MVKRRSYTDEVLQKEIQMVGRNNGGHCVEQLQESSEKSEHAAEIHSTTHMFMAGVEFGATQTGREQPKLLAMLSERNKRPCLALPFETLRSSQAKRYAPWTFDGQENESSFNRCDHQWLRSIREG